MPIIDCQATIGVSPRSSADLSPAVLLEAMRARNVGRALVAHTTAIYYDPAGGNREVEAIARENPGLQAAAVINPVRYPACLEETSRALSAGVTAFRFYPALHGYPFTAQVSAVREVLTVLKGARLLLVDWSPGTLSELTPAVAELLPAPTVLSTSNRDLGLALAAARVSPRLLIGTSYLTATGAIETAVRAVGAERVVFGSGAPLAALGSAVLSVQYAEVGDAERAAILEGNAARLLG